MTVTRKKGPGGVSRSRIRPDAVGAGRIRFFIRFFTGQI